jgi:hypothetical protein
MNELTITRPQSSMQAGSGMLPLGQAHPVFRKIFGHQSIYVLADLLSMGDFSLGYLLAPVYVTQPVRSISPNQKCLP